MGAVKAALETDLGMILIEPVRCSDREQPQHPRTDVVEQEQTVEHDLSLLLDANVCPGCGHLPCDEDDQYERSREDDWPD
jgi:hypothetical protein